MKRLLLSALTVAGMATLNAQSIKDLDFLIGTWGVEETIYPGTDREYKEKGTRTCEYYLDGSFIKCESTTIDQKNGKKRTYAYVINYDKKQDCFWSTSLANDFPLHGSHQWFLIEDQKVINAISPVNVIQDRFFRGTISYKNPNQMVWDGWASVYRQDKEWQQIFHDVATKVSE